MLPEKEGIKCQTPLLRGSYHYDVSSMISPSFLLPLPPSLLLPLLVHLRITARSPRCSRFISRSFPALHRLEQRLGTLFSNLFSQLAADRLVVGLHFKRGQLSYAPPADFSWIKGGRESTYQIGLQDPSRGFLVHHQASLRLRLLGGFDLAEILLHTLQFSVYGVVLGVYALESQIGY